MDLNLLIALDALLAENSVTAAAERLHLTAPAMSRALGRIRRAVGDDVLVRTGRHMTPTPRALALRDEVRELVLRAEALLAPVGEVDLAGLERTFAIQGHDALLTALAAPLLARVGAAAPGVRLRLLAEAPADTPDLNRGHVDLEVGTGPANRAELTTRTVAHDRLTTIVRDGHPLLGDPDRYATADHVIISRRGRLHDPVDTLLADAGIRRRVVASLPTAAAALQLVAASDVVVTGAELGCAPLVAQLGLRTLPLPVPSPEVPVVLAWHRSHDSDPAHRWLRTQVVEILTALT
ncbi:LysR family transcriptional regulator [Actinokineospora bangkokensis]|uniref:LysR family transcriptional regulator n=1 Tax=Actinokineospora bangkokensis TaxID=1193682 RepID=UPI000A021650